MTVIAYKKGVIAYDSRVSEGDSVVDENFNKHIEQNNVHFFLCGETGLFDRFVLHYNLAFSADQPGSTYVGKHLPVFALVWDGRNLYVAAVERRRIYRERLSIDGVAALGSGSDVALGAMDAGASAERAVRIAASRVTTVGGEVAVFRLRRPK